MTTLCWITAPFNNTRNLKFKSPPTVPFFAAVNHNLKICTSAINEPWKTETYKNNKMDWNPPIIAKNMTFWPVPMNREKQKPLKWIEIHQSQRRTWHFDPVELILFVFKDYHYVDWRPAKRNRWWWFKFQIPHVIERRSKNEQVWKQYVSQRVHEICHLTPKDLWDIALERLTLLIFLVMD